MLIQVKNLYKSYKEVKAVNGVSFDIDYGVCATLLGKNGAGKTTTVEMMEGILKPDLGTILYKGETPGEQFKIEAGIMFQSTALQEFITVREMLTMFHRLYPNPSSIDEVVELCELGEILTRDTRKLSGGQKQRLLLGIALINNPQILFLDEPTTGLDPKTRRNVWKIINDLKTKGKTIILTTHYMDEAYELSDVVLIMDQGKIIAKGSPDSLLREHFNDSVIELPVTDVPDQAIPEALVDRELLRFYSINVNDDIKRLLKAGASLEHLRIRSRNLEDLFLGITTDSPPSNTGKISK